jgi:hypothetical protein
MLTMFKMPLSRPALYFTALTLSIWTTMIVRPAGFQDPECPNFVFDMRTSGVKTKPQYMVCLELDEETGPMIFAGEYRDGTIKALRDWEEKLWTLAREFVDEMEMHPAGDVAERGFWDGWMQKML